MSEFIDAQTRGRLRAYLGSLPAADALWSRVTAVPHARRGKLIVDVTRKSAVGSARALRQLQALYRPVLGEAHVVGRELFYASPCRLEASRSFWADEDPQQAEDDQLVFLRLQTGAGGLFSEQAAVGMGRHALTRYLQRHPQPQLDYAVLQYHAALCSLPNWVVRVGLDIWCLETGSDGRGRGFPLPADGGVWITDFQLQPRGGRPMLVPSFFARTFISDGLMSERQEQSVAKVRAMLLPVGDKNSALRGYLHPEWLTNKEELTDRWTIDKFQKIREVELEDA